MKVKVTKNLYQLQVVEVVDLAGVMVVLLHETTSSFPLSLAF
jgi:hypothetical protein